MVKTVPGIVNNFGPTKRNFHFDYQKEPWQGGGVAGGGQEHIGHGDWFMSMNPVTRMGYSSILLPQREIPGENIDLPNWYYPKIGAKMEKKRRNKRYGRSGPYEDQNINVGGNVNIDVTEDTVDVVDNVTNEQPIPRRRQRGRRVPLPPEEEVVEEVEAPVIPFFPPMFVFPKPRDTELDQEQEGVIPGIVEREIPSRPWWWSNPRPDQDNNEPPSTSPPDDQPPPEEPPPVQTGTVTRTPITTQTATRSRTEYPRVMATTVQNGIITRTPVESTRAIMNRTEYPRAIPIRDTPEATFDTTSKEFFRQPVTKTATRNRTEYPQAIPIKDTADVDFRNMPIPVYPKISSVVTNQTTRRKKLSPSIQTNQQEPIQKPPTPIPIRQQEPPTTIPIRQQEPPTTIPIRQQETPTSVVDNDIFDEQMSEAPPVEPFREYTQQEHGLFNTIMNLGSTPAPPPPPSVIMPEPTFIPTPTPIFNTPRTNFTPIRQKPLRKPARDIGPPLVSPEQQDQFEDFTNRQRNARKILAQKKPEPEPQVSVEPPQPEPKRKGQTFQADTVGSFIPRPSIVPSLKAVKEREKAKRLEEARQIEEQRQIEEEQVLIDKRKEERLLKKAQRNELRTQKKMEAAVRAKAEEARIEKNRIEAIAMLDRERKEQLEAEAKLREEKALKLKEIQDAWSKKLKEKSIEKQHKIVFEKQQAIERSGEKKRESTIPQIIEKYKKNIPNERIPIGKKLKLKESGSYRGTLPKQKESGIVTRNLAENIKASVEGAQPFKVKPLVNAIPPPPKNTIKGSIARILGGMKPSGIGMGMDSGQTISRNLGARLPSIVTSGGRGGYGGKGSPSPKESYFGTGNEEPNIPSVPASKRIRKVYENENDIQLEDQAKGKPRVLKVKKKKRKTKET